MTVATGSCLQVDNLQTAVVLTAESDSCLVFSRGRRLTVGYAAPFRPRVAGLSPGQLVAVTHASSRIVWRWFDALVLDIQDDRVHLWEPAHGEVVARPRRPEQQLRIGARAYVSAGLPGADWWVAGSADAPAGEACVELDEVVAFFHDLGLWDAIESD